MTGSATDSTEIVLLRHIPGGTQYQGKPPLRITSENFKLRRNRETDELETGISVSSTNMGNHLSDAQRVFKLRRTGPDSRIGYASKLAIVDAGFTVQDDPTEEDEAHCLIKSASTHLEDHPGRRKLAALFSWVTLTEQTEPSRP